MEELAIEASAQGVLVSAVKVKHAKYSIKERIYCNYCSTSIGDHFRRCPLCKIELCLSCCQEIRQKDPLHKRAKFGKCVFKNCWHVGLPPSKPTSNKPKWVFNDTSSITCLPTELGGCGKSSLELTRIFQKDWISTLEKKADSILQKIKSPLLEPNCDTYSNVAQRERSDNNFIYCPSPKDISEMEDLTRFRQHWREGQPVIVKNVLKKTSGLSWEPTVMTCAVRKHLSEVITIDCLSGCKASMPVMEFFKSYEDESGPMLKVKDFPSDVSYEKVMPRHYDEFICALPFQEYTNPVTGILNVATKLPPDIIKTDLGPKSYIAHGNTEELENGNSVTRIHCDMADAVNIMVHVNEESEGTGGALWDIFRREDTEKLREYLSKHWNEFQYSCGRCSIDNVYNPILDQSFYLTLEHKEKLKAEYGVEPWTFTQHLGEAVLIPAGCPHQVRNLKTCMKVAMDFVSPESLQECTKITKEFRKLPHGHDSVEDKLEIKKMVVHAMEKILKDIEGLQKAAGLVNN